MKLLPQAALVLVAAGLIGFAGFVLITGDSTAAPVRPMTPPAQAMFAKPPALPSATFGDGRHEVLAEVPAGIYRTDGSTDDDFPLCSWRLYESTHLVSAGSATGPVSIVIEPTHDEVQSIACKPWRRIG
ncbi:MAG: hypothetical protein JO296_21250 [Pseudonocardiales bacterium]|nr:hypothetical protein [Pseudonocardiales bacterium]